MFADEVSAWIPAEDPGLLRVSYAIIYEITRYLARHGDDSDGYLVFMNSDAPEDSNLALARKSIFRLTEILVAYLSAVSPSSPLRQAHSGIFDLLGALEPLYIIYDESEWRFFWSRAQPVILELGVQLDQAGFGGD
ncbi:hypothetical protein DFH07DRAFT_952076 [Mycena maculata]|uniref:Uncharacterized protein n=1 Tax=Mycena maculata TaxID=230809 RepID=A0AAD7K4Q8_9AGAR|nr:hypothetical protein DFH07DRAFT_952076 [Mycena maculata]